jgi:omega-amidase
MKPESLRVAAVQLRFRATVVENAENLARWVKKLARRGADAVLFPECATTGYAVDFATIPRSDIEAGLNVVAVAAREARCHVLVGSPSFAGRRRYNSLLVYDRTGREVFRYSKIHLTERDQAAFCRGQRLAIFPIDGIPCTAIICHERRYPELVRLPVMMGAQIVFHPNAGLDALKVSKSKRGGKDGIAVRAFENQVHYVFANSVGPQAGGLWSAGDSKIVAADSQVLALADNRREMAIQATLDLSMAGRKYAREALEQPALLRKHWRAMLAACRRAL